MEQEYLKADPGYRRKVIIWLVLIFVLGSVALGLGLPLAKQKLGEMEPGAAIMLVKYAYIVVLLPLGAFCIYLFCLAMRSLAQGQFPPLGTKVVKDTLLYRGQEARKRALLLVFLGVGIILLCAYSVVIMFRLLS